MEHLSLFKAVFGGSVKSVKKSVNYSGILSRHKSGICTLGLLLLQNRSYYSLAHCIANSSEEKPK